MKFPTKKCKRCGAVVMIRVPNPKKCAKCKSIYWQKNYKLKK